MATKSPPADQPGTTVFVLFGATGDLSKKMVLPAFFILFREGYLPKSFRLIGYTNENLPRFDMAARVKLALDESGTEYTKKDLDAFKKYLMFAHGPIDVGGEHSLKETISKARTQLKDPGAQLVHYLAVPPLAFGPITEDLGRHGLADGARVVYEKPFGTSADAFKALDKTVSSVLEDDQVYRIDHFLGKQATQQLHTMRFANGMFDSIWNNRHIRSVQIDVPEKIGVSDRSKFYDATGATLDMLVSHLFQVAAEVAMEPPKSLDPDDLQDARSKVIKKFRPIDPDDAVLGQFTGYKSLDHVARGSRTDTFVACRMWVDTPRWKGVPFLMRTGKRMAIGEQRVSLILHDPAGPLAGHLPEDNNVVAMSLKGDGKVILRLTVEKPDATLSFTQAETVIDLGEITGADPIPPYARLIHDALRGDRSLFTRPDGLDATWKIVGPLLEAHAGGEKPKPYKQGSWGPAAAKRLAEPDGWVLGQ